MGWWCKELQEFSKQFQPESHMSEDLSLIHLKESPKPDSRLGLFIRSKTTLDDAWAALDMAYGKANTVRDAVLRDLKEWNPVYHQSDAEGLRALVNDLSLAKEDHLAAVKRTQALGDSAFSVVMGIIPSELRRRIDKSILEEEIDTEESVDALLNVMDSAPKHYFHLYVDDGTTSLKRHRTSARPNVRARRSLFQNQAFHDSVFWSWTCTPWRPGVLGRQERTNGSFESSLSVAFSVNVHHSECE